MLLRIEDTDVERSRQHHAEQIVASLQWLGVEWDEGPLFQTDRLDRYRERTEELIVSGAAYRCYCTVEELDAEGKPQRKRAGLTSTPADAGLWRRMKRSGMKVTSSASGCRPDRSDSATSSGAMSTSRARLIDDFVLLRSDSYPTYHLSVVVDDIDMAITIVARGDDHLSNTPKHVLLLRAFRAPVPIRSPAPDSRQ